MNYIINNLRILFSKGFGIDETIVGISGDYRSLLGVIL